MDIKEFKEKLSKIKYAESTNGKSYYDSIAVTDSGIVFKRKGNDRCECIDIQKLFRFYINEPVENIKTPTAKKYMLGGVQSPAVAILHKLIAETRLNK